MRLAIDGALDAAQLAELRRLLARGRYEDGRMTAGEAARQVKNNLQLDPSGPEFKEALAIVQAAIRANEALQSAALPRFFGGVLFSRYEPGMGYGAHVDNAMIGAPQMRSDLAFTLFLAGPADYQGGELVLMDPGGERTVKLPAGSLFVYPATTLHRVEPVTAGRRDVCVGWIQSLVRDERMRELIYDLARAKDMLKDQPGQREARDLISRTRANLLRMHAE